MSTADSLSELTDARKSTRRSFWWRFRRHRMAIAGFALFVLLSGSALFAPLIAWHDANKIDLDNFDRGPSLTHPFGTDKGGSRPVRQAAGRGTRLGKRGDCRGPYLGGHRDASRPGFRLHRRVGRQLNPALHRAGDDLPYPVRRADNGRDLRPQCLQRHRRHRGARLDRKVPPRARPGAVAAGDGLRHRGEGGRGRQPAAAVPSRTPRCTALRGTGVHDDDRRRHSYRGVTQLPGPGRPAAASHVGEI